MRRVAGGGRCGWRGQQKREVERKREREGTVGEGRERPERAPTSHDGRDAHTHGVDQAAGEGLLGTKPEN